MNTTLRSWSLYFDLLRHFYFLTFCECLILFFLAVCMSYYTCWRCPLNGTVCAWSSFRVFPHIFPPLYQKTSFLPKALTTCTMAWFEYGAFLIHNHCTGRMNCRILFLLAAASSLKALPKMASQLQASLSMLTERRECFLTRRFHPWRVMPDLDLISIRPAIPFWIQGIATHLTWSKGARWWWSYGSLLLVDRASAYETFLSVEVFVATSLLLPSFLMRLLWIVLKFW